MRRLHERFPRHFREGERGRSVAYSNEALRAIYAGLGEEFVDDLIEREDPVLCGCDEPCSTYPDCPEIPASFRQPVGNSPADRFADLVVDLLGADGARDLVQVMRHGRESC